MYKIFFLIVLLFCGPVYADEEPNSKVITIVADPWCPYNCSPDSNAPGLTIELLKMIFEPYHYKIDYKTLAWKRAVALVEEGKYMALAATYKQDAPNLIYPNAEIVKSNLGFFTQPSNLWRYAGPDSLKKVKKILLIDGYSYGSDLDNLFGQYKDIVVYTKSPVALIDNINAVIAGDADVLVEDINVVNYNLFLMNQVNRLTLASKFLLEKVFIGFSPNIKEVNDLVTIYNAEFPKIQQDGRLTELLLKYGIVVSKEVPATTNNNKINGSGGSEPSTK